MDSMGLRKSAITKVDEEEEEEEKRRHRLGKPKLKKMNQAFDSKRARGMASPDTCLNIGSIGAVMAGRMLPMWGVLFWAH
jgi:hypothetical protein